MNDNLGLCYDLYSWRTAENQEVDFVLYGEKGIIAIEAKRTDKIRAQDTKGLKAFLKEYPMAKAFMQKNVIN